MLPAPSFEADFPIIEIKEIFNLIKKKTSLGDALMIAVSEKHLSFVSTMVSWDHLHFENIFPGTVVTPEIFLS